MILAGVLTAVGVFILLLKLPVAVRSRLLGFDYVLDLSVTVILMVALAGTYSGMMAAIVGGINFSISLWIAKKILGYKKLTRFEGKWVWLSIPPIWRK